MKLPEFDIHPYVGALPLRFGLPRAEVPAVFDSPPLRSRDEDDYFGAVRVAYYGTGTIAEIGFVPRGVTLRFMGTELWNEQTILDPVPLLLQHDPDPLETVGFLVFLALGVTVTGFHDGDTPQRALTVFRRGHWDTHLSDAKKPRLTKYRKKRSA